MTDRDNRVYANWRQYHPDFDPNDYARWIAQRGYYRLALDISRPEFYEYATLYLGQRADTDADAAHPH